jgi:hypothetical protein
MAGGVARKLQHDDLAVAENVLVGRDLLELAAAGQPVRQGLHRILVHGRSPPKHLEIGLPHQQLRVRESAGLADMVEMPVADPDRLDLLGPELQLGELVDDASLDPDGLGRIVEVVADQGVGEAGVPQHVMGTVADQIAASDDVLGTRRILEGVGEEGAILLDDELAAMEPPKLDRRLWSRRRGGRARLRRLCGDGRGKRSREHKGGERKSHEFPHRWTAFPPETVTAPARPD